MVVATPGGFDSGARDASPDALPPPDAGHVDGGPVDSGPRDAGPVDAGPPDAGPVDAGHDAGPPDAGYDAGPPDAGHDAGPPDAGYDAGPPDAGYDAGSPDAGYDAGPPDAGPSCDSLYGSTNNYRFCGSNQFGATCTFFGEFSGTSAMTHSCGYLCGSGNCVQESAPTGTSGSNRCRVDTASSPTCSQRLAAVICVCNR